MLPDPATRPGKRLVWPWLGLILAMGWIGLVRVPLVLNARNHLDSDLAVDGLTLLDAVKGQWRWHYPGTPFIGSPPVLLSYVQARVRGVDPITLVSGGVVAYLGLTMATFLLNLRAFGPAVATWGLVPLAFASTGTVWLSGRITGGHLLTVAWHAGAFALLHGALTRGGVKRSAILGLWCGLGLFLDSMFAVTWLALIPSGLLGWWGLRRVRLDTKPPGRVLTCLLTFALMAGLGVAPRFIGQRVDPHDSYRDQFEPDFSLEGLRKHGSILARDCLPRLIAGHRLPGYQSEPDPSSLPGGLTRGAKVAVFPSLPLAVSVVALSLFAGSMVALGFDRPSKGDPARLAIRLGLWLSTAIVVAGFVVNRNIVNSDNYRYLVFLLVPWSSGFGMLFRGWSRTGSWGIWAALVVAVGFGALMTVDTTRWYARFGWVDDASRPTLKSADDPALTWLLAHPETSSIYGDYWDVYRLSFLTGGKVLAVPFPEYPDRFNITRTLPGGRPRTLVVGPGGIAPRYRALAMFEGAREVERAPNLSIVDWPLRGPLP